MLKYCTVFTIFFFSAFFFVATKFLNSVVGVDYLHNLFFIFTIFLGWDIMIILYSLEWYSRINCDGNQVSFLKRLI